MAHAIIRGNNGRRHEVDFGDSPIRVEVHASEETVEIFVEAGVFRLVPTILPAWCRNSDDNTTNLFGGRSLNCPPRLHRYYRIC
jgi:hypothetical protein